MTIERISVNGLALSTMWGIGRFKDVAEFIAAGSEIGFTHFELNHGVNSTMIDGLDLSGYRIPSIHEPCPADVSVGELRRRNWLVSAANEQEREHGVAAIRRSIDLAHRLGATAVIVHPGKVDIDSTPELQMMGMYRRNQSTSAEYRRAQEQLMSARAARAKTNVDAVRRSLIELAEYARPLGIRLGLENRYHYHEIPSPDELDILLGIGYEDVIGFWYDVGHAQVLDRLGFYPHEEWLKRFSSRMIGVHLHDVVGIDDHRAAGTGEVDWGMVARYVPKHALHTCEFQNNNSPQEIQAGVAFLVKQGCPGVGD